MKSIPPQMQAQVDLVTQRMDSAKPRHERHRKSWEGFYAQYRAFQDVKRQHGQSRTPRDVDDILSSAKRQFGAQLFIPYAFSVIETVLPRMLANSPKVTVRGKKPEWEDLAEPIKFHIEAQEDEADYPLTLQDVGKSGLIYGLGVQKLPWVNESRESQRLAPALVPSAEQPFQVEKFTETIYSGPRPECVDVFDWIWDPLAHSMKTLSWCVHRTWRDDRYVREMLEKGAWSLPPEWEIADALEAAAADGRADVWKARERAAGRDQSGKASEGKVHQIWEYHDGKQVILVLDAKVVVAAGPNPYWHGQIPFQIYRPTKLPHEMVGIGEIESISDLIDEMNTLRTQRRDNAALVLQRPFAYFDGLVDPGDIAFGPGIGIPVDGDPREVIFPLPLQDIPASGYQEESNLTRDIERTTGIDDSVAGVGGQGGQSDTATGIQLVQAAANVRIQNKTKLLQRECVKPAGRQWFRLNAQHITKPVTIVGPPAPGTETARDFSYYVIGPEQYAGEFFVDIDDGSMEPINHVAKSQAGLQTLQAFQGNPSVDQDKLAEWALGQMGVQNPRSYLTPKEPTVPLHALDALRMLLEQLGQQDPAQLEHAIVNPQAFQMLVEQVSQGGPAAGAIPPGLPSPPPQPPVEPPPEPAPAPAPAPPPTVNVLMPDAKSKKVTVLRDERDQIIGYEEIKA